jgi:hypothetical protein
MKISPWSHVAASVIDVRLSAFRDAMVAPSPMLNNLCIIISFDLP